MLAYAGRALQLSQEVAGTQLEQSFLDRLEKAPSNMARWGNGAGIYRGLIEPLRLDLLRVAAHHAIACEFDGDHEVNRVYCYTAEKAAYEHLAGGVANLGLGRTRIRSTITGNEAVFTFAVLHLGGHSLNAGVREYESVEAFEAMRRDIREAFEKGDIAEVVRLMDKHFGSHSYTLWHLFRDEQRKAVNQIMDQALQEIEASFAQIYDRHYSLMRFLHQIDMPVPRSLATPVEEVLNAQLRRALEADIPDLERIRAIAAELEQLPVALDEASLGFVAKRQIDRLMEKLTGAPFDRELLQTINDTLEVLLDLPLTLDLWKAQNSYFFLYQERRGEIEATGEKGESMAAELLEQLNRLGSFLQVETG